MVRKALLLLILLVFISHSKELRVYFIDVGEGESILVMSPSGKATLIDAGNLITGYKVLKFLKSKGINEIERLIVTHPHPDHMGGVFILLQSFDVKQWYDNGQPLEKVSCEDLYRWYGELFRRGNYGVLKAGDRWEEDGAIYEVLSPKRLNRGWNANSLVIKLTYGKVGFLFMGDANVKAEKELIGSGTDLRSDVLKVGHHGAGDTLSEEFLRKVKPEYAVISINRKNIRGYPSKEKVELLKKYGVRLYTTYEHGTVVFSTDGNKIEVWSE
ncbi:ComEC/Rec2 family competence protein [Hydrogenivirga sp. 128-5-R1-1]|uniref:ComEC/Rec2 family competence protein n=1 Tax=Hydrogenivirga sp. 128-5-R1-1 TaxID=392423 RepID=UPI00015EF7B7|nr:ComEC/Rec2 family competence protein [Hydrogenivirga sp. 128-5-R1-1]EDP75588.1 predicted hydrolase of metallo-beta-lactamase fold protein [Hydrogenivirga sp. 128-5-R1-1]